MKEIVEDDRLNIKGKQLPNYSRSNEPSSSCNKHALPADPVQQ
jgi:hypothetical protein